jgi:hypothetical protein
MNSASFEKGQRSYLSPATSASQRGIIGTQKGGERRAASQKIQWLIED